MPHKGRKPAGRGRATRSTATPISPIHEESGTDESVKNDGDDTAAPRDHSPDVENTYTLRNINMEQADKILHLEERLDRSRRDLERREHQLRELEEAGAHRSPPTDLTYRDEGGVFMPSGRAWAGASSTSTPTFGNIQPLVPLSPQQMKADSHVLRRERGNMILQCYSLGELDILLQDVQKERQGRQLLGDNISQGRQLLGDN